MARVLPVIIAIALMVYALIDCLQTENFRIRALNKLAWVAIIIVLPIIGPALWLTLGKLSDEPRPVQPQPRPVAPDDDPAFLRELHNLDEEHEKLLNEWEDSLRRREEDLRKRESPTTDDTADDTPDTPDDSSRSDNTSEELRKRGDAGDDDTR